MSDRKIRKVGVIVILVIVGFLVWGLWRADHRIAQQGSPRLSFPVCEECDECFASGETCWLCELRERRERREEEKGK